MKNMQVRLCLFAMGLFIVLFPSVLSCTESRQPETKKNISDALAPDFNLKDLTGRSFKLSTHRDKPVLLIFITTWCPTCRSEIPHYKEIYETYSRKGLEVVSIDIQEPKERVARLVARYSIPYKTLLDESGDVASSYGIIGIPSMILVNKGGTILSRQYSAIDTILETLLEKK